MDFRICDCDGVTMAKKKYKWYKDLWGWIGFFVYIIIIIYASYRDVSGNSIQSNSFIEKSITFVRYILPEFSCSQGFIFSICMSDLLYIFIVTPIVYFLFGLLLHKLFIKLKWVRR